MNSKLKKIIVFPAVCIASTIIASGTPASANIIDSIKSGLSSALKSENGESNFDFIKSNQTAKDIIYDGSLLLYGGISFIVISALGIFFTLKPKRKKKLKNKSKKAEKNISGSKTH